MDKLNDSPKQQHMNQGVMGGKASGNHLHQLVLGIIDEKPGINRQKYRKITDEDQSCRKQESSFLPPPGIVPFCACGFCGCRPRLLPLKDPVPGKAHKQRAVTGKNQNARPETELPEINALPLLQLCADAHAE